MRKQRGDLFRFQDTGFLAPHLWFRSVSDGIDRNDLLLHSELEHRLEHGAVVDLTLWPQLQPQNPPCDRTTVP